MSYTPSGARSSLSRATSGSTRTVRGPAVSWWMMLPAARAEASSRCRMHANVLESARYPDIAFRPDRGTHEMLMKVKTHIEQQQLTAAISFTVPYVKLGMKDPSNFLLKVKDVVDIDIQTTAHIK